MRWRLVLGFVFGLLVMGTFMVYGQGKDAGKVMRVRRTGDFDVNGVGDAENWSKAEWVSLSLRRTDRHKYETRIKMLYSESGVYVLMEAEDRFITATMEEDFLDLWNEDVFEFFFWTDAIEGFDPDHECLHSYQYG